MCAGGSWHGSLVARAFPKHPHPPNLCSASFHRDKPTCCARTRDSPQKRDEEADAAAKPSPLPHLVPPPPPPSGSSILLLVTSAALLRFGTRPSTRPAPCPCPACDVCGWGK